MALMSVKYEIKNEIIPKELDIYPDLLQRLLVNRGIVNKKDAENYLNLDYVKDSNSAGELKDAEKSANRIIDAIKNNEHVIIFSDYDADGIPGAVILGDFFTWAKFSNFSHYIPDRHNDGFGLNNNFVSVAIDRGAKLVITIDCGIVDVRPAKLLKEADIDLIITDHHLPQEIPPAFAIVDPKQEECNYPWSDLCGAGVIFKVIQKILEINRFGIKEEYEKWLLDMVALATVSDMVPLKGENRTLAHYGIKVMRKSRRPGLVELMKKAGVKQETVNEDDITFSISPRINAASRLGDAMQAFYLLSAKDEEEAKKYASYIEDINNKRKTSVALIVKEIKKEIAHRNLSDKKVLVIGNPNWRPGILGHVATSIVRDVGKPIFLWGREDGENYKGSARSDGSMNIFELTQKAPKETFLQAGGHKMACGFTINPEKIHQFDQILNETANGLQELEPEKVFIDEEMSLDDVNMENYKIIEQVGPYGMGNPKPIFLFKGIVVKGVKKFGKGEDHLELQFENSKNRKVKAISFFNGFDFKEGQKINLVANIEKNGWNGFTEIRLKVVDVV